MRRAVQTLLVICSFSVCCLLPFSAFGQTRTSKLPGTQQSKPTPTPATPSASAPATAHDGDLAKFQAKIPSLVKSASQPPGDYVPCEFTLNQLNSLRLQPVLVRLSGVEEEKLKTDVIAEALSQSNSGAFGNGKQASFVRLVSESSLEGRTPSEALAMIIQILRENDAPASPAATALVTAATNPTGRLDTKNETDVKNLAVTQAGGNEAYKEFLTKSVPLANLTTSQALQTLASKTNEFVNTPGSPQTPVSPPEPVKSALPPSDSGAKAVVTNAQQGADATGTSYNSANQAIVDAARNSVAVFERPPDVGCAMSILSWNETRYAYGNLIAGEYIAVQITVRNLNDQEDFLIHDAEFAVDVDPAGSLGRFYSGRDKIIVRALSLANQDYSPRNLIVHSLQGVGTLMSAVIPAAGATYAVAAGVFNSGFLPGLSKAWPDYSNQQLNLLNDTGFSSTSNFKTTVPKSGSAMFVMFVPSKEFQEGWWTQPCVENLVVGVDANGKIQRAGSQPASEVNPDLAFAVCKNDLKAVTSGRKVTPGITTGGTTTGGTTVGGTTVGGTTTGGLTVGGTTYGGATIGGIPSDDPTIQYMAVKPVSYKKWPPISGAIFKALSFAVVAGVHIPEASETATVVSQITCPHDAVGDLDLNHPTGDSLVCDLKGQNLNKIAIIRLRNSDPITDPVIAEGSVTGHGDSTVATLSLPLSQMGALMGKKYLVNMVDKDTVETGTSLVLNLNLDPVLSSLDLATIALDKQTNPASIIVQLSGYHLDKLAQISFSGAPLSASVVVTVDQATPANPLKASITLKSSDAAVAPLFKPSYGTPDPIKNPGLNIVLVTKDATAKNIKTTKTLTLTGTLTASTP
jgi:hypothetical protein